MAELLFLIVLALLLKISIERKDQIEDDSDKM